MYHYTWMYETDVATSWNRKWAQVKLRSELTISEQCSERISHKHAHIGSPFWSLRYDWNGYRHKQCNQVRTHIMFECCC